jgi:peptide/nickel transport system ATP-binding protein
VRLHRGLKKVAAHKRVLELLEAVGIPDPAQRYEEYPHQLSGGMKQRIMIAIALAGEPDLLIADEPTTALDVTIQAQVLDLMRQLQKDTGMAMLLITHDLGVVSEMADRVAVMYAGQIVEEASRADFFANPKHPYSQKLFESLPDMEKRGQRLAVIPGHVPSLATDFTGCRFEERCSVSWEACVQQLPLWTALDSVGGNAGVRCLLHESSQPPSQQAAQQQDVTQTAQPKTPGKQAEVVFNVAENQLGELASSTLNSQHAVSTDAPILLDVKALKVHFPIHKGLLQRVVNHVKAVDGVSLSIPAGHTLALVGESGCGKTTVGKSILQLIRPTAGNVAFNGVDLTQLSAKQLRAHRGDIQIIFQDPFSSMNPRMMVADIIEEGMITQGLGRDAATRAQRVDELLNLVGLSASVKHRYPHEFSGGQRQRICIARALAVEPKLIICDEPTSALDVSVQAQILNLLKDLQRQLGLSYLFITHDLSVVEYLADEVAVMYLGRIVEQGEVRALMENPKHPYTQALLEAVPVIDRSEKYMLSEVVTKVQGEMPSPIEPPSGCHFHPRCPDVMAQCKLHYPDVQQLADKHMARCFLYPAK